MTEGGQKAKLQVVITAKTPEEVLKQQKLPPAQRAELILKFVKEGDQWKWGPPTILGNPDERARPKDFVMGSRSDYKGSSNMKVAVQILRIEKQSAGTVFLIRVLDEEIAAFVPAAKLSSEFVPGSVLVLQGAEHKSHRLKHWADEASLHQR